MVPESIVAGRYGSRSKKLKSHMLNHKHQAEWTNWKWYKIIKHSQPSSRKAAPPQRFYNLPKQSHWLKSRCLNPGAVGDIPIQTTTRAQLSKWRTNKVAPILNGAKLPLALCSSHYCPPAHTALRPAMLQRSLHNLHILWGRLSLSAPYPSEPGTVLEHARCAEFRFLLGL